MTDAEAQEVEGLLLAKREDGDGHEEPDKVLHSDPSGMQKKKIIIIYLTNLNICCWHPQEKKILKYDLEKVNITVQS